MESLNKRYRIQHAAVELFQEQGVESTSVNEIVQRANVAKGTFYVYYKDKRELISQILTIKQGIMLNDILNTSYELAHCHTTCWKECFTNEMIAHHQNHPDLLKMMQKNITSILDTEEHREEVFQQVERLDEFLSLMRREHEDRKQTLNRFMLIMQIIGVVCYNAIFYDQPDHIEHILPELKRTISKMMESEA